MDGKEIAKGWEKQKRIAMRALPVVVIIGGISYYYSTYLRPSPSPSPSPIDDNFSAHYSKPINYGILPFAHSNSEMIITEEYKQLEEQLRINSKKMNWINLYGPPGLGKTSLAAYSLLHHNTDSNDDNNKNDNINNDINNNNNENQTNNKVMESENKKEEEKIWLRSFISFPTPTTPPPKPTPRDIKFIKEEEEINNKLIEKELIYIANKIKKTHTQMANDIAALTAPIDPQDDDNNNDNHPHLMNLKPTKKKTITEYYSFGEVSLDDEQLTMRNLKAYLEEHPGWMIVFDNINQSSFDHLKPFLPSSGGSLLFTSSSPLSLSTDSNNHINDNNNSDIVDDNMNNEESKIKNEMKKIKVEGFTEENVRDYFASSFPSLPSPSPSLFSSLLSLLSLPFQSNNNKNIINNKNNNDINNIIDMNKERVRYSPLIISNAVGYLKMKMMRENKTIDQFVMEDKMKEMVDELGAFDFANYSSAYSLGPLLLHPSFSSYSLHLKLSLLLLSTLNNKNNKKNNNKNNNNKLIRDKKEIEDEEQLLKIISLFSPTHFSENQILNTFIDWKFAQIGQSRSMGDHDQDLIDDFTNQFYSAFHSLYSSNLLLPSITSFPSSHTFNHYLNNNINNNNNSIDDNNNNNNMEKYKIMKEEDHYIFSKIFEKELINKPSLWQRIKAMIAPPPTSLIDCALRSIVSEFSQTNESHLLKSLLLFRHSLSLQSLLLQFKSNNNNKNNNMKKRRKKEYMEVYDVDYQINHQFNFSLLSYYQFSYSFLNLKNSFVPSPSRNTPINLLKKKQLLEAILSLLPSSPLPPHTPIHQLIQLNIDRSNHYYYHSSRRSQSPLGDRNINNNNKSEDKRLENEKERREREEREKGWVEKANTMVDLAVIELTLRNEERSKELFDAAIDLYSLSLRPYIPHFSQLFNPPPLTNRPIDEQFDDQQMKDRINVDDENARKEIEKRVKNIVYALANRGTAEGRLNHMEGKQHSLLIALSLSEHLFGRSHLETAKLLTNIANAFDDSSLKITLFERALSIYEKAYGGRSHPDLSTILLNLSSAYANLLHFDHQLELIDQAIDIRRHFYGDRSLETAKMMINCGNMIGYSISKLKASGQSIDEDDQRYLIAHSNELVSDGLQLMEALFGGDVAHGEFVDGLNVWGRLLGLAERREEQRDVLSRSLSLSERLFGKTTDNVAMVLFNLSVVYVHLDEYDQARKCAMRARDIWVNHHPNPKLADEASHVISSLSKILSE